jgi:two-component system NarL family response regulator
VIRVLIAAGQRAFAEALAMRFDSEPDLEVVATATHAEEALRAATASPVDLAVIDVDALESFVALGDRLRVIRPGIASVGLTDGGDDPAALTAAVHQGVRGWVRKTADISELLAVVRRVHGGETSIPPRLLTGLLDRLLSEGADERAADLLLASLTSRERRVLQAMSEGAGRQEIADELGISVNTVRTHTQNILTKLDVHSSLAAVRVARRAGLG